MDLDLSATFQREQRIVKTDEFSSVFSLRPVFRTAHFVLYIRPNNVSAARLGVVAAKKLAPRAVTRNTVKRMTREIFRQTPLPKIDCIVRLSKAVNTKAGPATNLLLRRQLKTELMQLFESQHRNVNTPAAHPATANAAVIPVSAPSIDMDSSVPTRASMSTSDLKGRP